MSKRVTRTDVMYRVMLPGDVVQDCATMGDALEWIKNTGAIYVGEIKVLRAMSLESWIANSEIVKEEA
jgi:hypothetical protein